MTNFLKFQPTITVCSSTKFWDDIILANAILATKNIMGFSPGFPMKQPENFPGAVEYLEKNQDVNRHLGVLHYQKIMRSDAIWVIDTNGYVGESTIKEIKFAHELGKPIFITEQSELLQDLSYSHPLMNIKYEIVPLSFDSEFPIKFMNRYRVVNPNMAAVIYDDYVNGISGT